MEEKYRHFLFGIVASAGLCFIILVFFTGDEVCINSKLLNISEWVLLGLISATVILGLSFLAFVIKANHETRDIKNTRWHIVTECLQDQELRSKRKLLFHPEVTVFPDSVISYCEAVERVEFAGSDCYFMLGSFEGCVNLEYIKLPHRLERIPDNMFKNCSSLKEIIIPSTVKSIGKNAFDGCIGLTSVIFVKGSKLESIGRGAFKGCSGLTSVEIPAGVVDPGLFPAVTGECRVVVTGEITGSTVEKLRSMIDGMSAGAKIHLDLSKTTGLTTIAGFDGCRRLVSVKIPDGVTSIGNGAFWGCSSLTSVEIPDGVTSIGSYAFSGCSGLTSVTFEAGSQLESIGSHVFDGCSGLTSVEIPAGVTIIDYLAFEGCSGLNVYYQGDLARWCEGFGLHNSIMEKCENLYINGELIEGDLIIPDGVTKIGARVFYGYRRLTSVEIPATVTCIEYFAFYGCSGLTSVRFREGSKLDSIGDEAFRGCSGLTSVEIPSSVTSIGTGAFSGCSGLTCVTFGADSRLESIDNYAFMGCNGLTSVEIPESVTSIGSEAFKGCSGLTSVEIPESVTSIGRGAFKGCSGLTSVEIPAGVTFIGSSAFRECSGLTSVIFEDTSGWYVTQSYADAANKTGGTAVTPSPTDLAANAAELVNDANNNKNYWYKVD